MQDQIECVGGPLDGQTKLPHGDEITVRVVNRGKFKTTRNGQEVVTDLSNARHLYHLESGKYVYKGVRR